MAPTGVCADTLVMESVTEISRIAKAETRVHGIGALLKVID
jgi:hypothetical protein